MSEREGLFIKTSPVLQSFSSLRSLQLAVPSQTKLFAMHSPLPHRYNPSPLQVQFFSSLPSSQSRTPLHHFVSGRHIFPSHIFQPAAQVLVSQKLCSSSAPFGHCCIPSQVSPYEMHFESWLQANASVSLHFTKTTGEASMQLRPSTSRCRPPVQ